MNNFQLLLWITGLKVLKKIASELHSVLRLDMCTLESKFITYSQNR